MMRPFHYEDIPYGFRWGPLEIERVGSFEKWGVVLELKTPKQSLLIRVTPSGLIRVGEVQ